MKRIKIPLAASLIVLLAACTKNEAPVGMIVNNSKEYARASQNMMVSAAANKQNPYDAIGYYHNIGLDSLRQYVKTNKDTTRKGKYAYLSQYFTSNFKVAVIPVYDPKERLACTDYKTIWLTQKVSPPAKAYWQALSDAAQGIKDLDHYDRFKQQVMRIEEKINADTLAAVEKKNLLMTAAIIRYSGYYWMGVFKRGEVTEHNGQGTVSTNSLIRKIAGVISGICADASVVAAGYITGNYLMLAEAELWSEICGYYTGWW